MISIALQLSVRMEILGWLVDHKPTKAGWRFAIMDSGGRFVMMDGMVVKLGSSVDS